MRVPLREMLRRASKGIAIVSQLAFWGKLLNHVMMLAPNVQLGGTQRDSLVAWRRETASMPGRVFCVIKTRMGNRRRVRLRAKPTEYHATPT